ncbi:hypothetical protein UB43_25035 [Pseudomonas sp. 21]|uniref:hypothetical protein n=1 Tax=unclassified Pseudomonas TaxID=196821 RepID=UPI0005EB4395|nr:MULTISPECIES: hypothetical protein [unclassified Pseudomonas]KJJ97124.1 hypothetical protein UB43_25035 [Pseudomonas sp. 21]MBV7583139.1 hypothetical protein [Pseudomonas sp. PDM33]
MKTIQLQHDAKLGYLLPKQLRAIPADLDVTQDCEQLISFRAFKDRSPNVTVKKVHAAKRPLDIYGAGSYCFYGLQSDSPLAPLLLWDAAHFLEVGKTLTLVEDVPQESYLDRDYFTGALTCVERSPTRVTYRKVARLPAEADDDLDSWTFGLPVGPEDATVLNAVVQRILELDIPNKEILLCGTPGKNFRYFDQVRIVGEDITAPPVQICKKKNRLAQEARYNNLVILHDRVFLPSHFGEMVRRFGPRYPLMTLQSLFFDNRVCLYPRRYSDLGMSVSEMGGGIKGLHRTSQSAVTVAPSTFTELERSGFCFANPIRYNNDISYPTGSLYICRKEVWECCPLDESLLWVEYEDIEHGIRSSKLGVPTRVNPYGITQTVTSRAVLGSTAFIETANGSIKSASPNNLSLLPKKPLLRMTTAAALARLQQFASKYVTDETAAAIPTGLKEIKARRWVGLISTLIRHSSFRNDLASVRQFISDFEKLVLLDQLPDGLRLEYEQRFLKDPADAKHNFIVDCWPIRSMIKQRTVQTWFFESPQEYFHNRSLSLPGVLLSALSLYRNNGKFFYFTSFRECLRSIHNSTPFDRYARTEP